MQLCNDTVSLFNKLPDGKRGYYWRKTLLRGVSWYAKDISSVTNDGLQTARQFVVRIPNAEGYGDTWTLHNGDYMVKGDVEYTAAMAETYAPDVMTVTAVIDNRRAPHAPHIKVLGA